MDDYKKVIYGSGTVAVYLDRDTAKLLADLINYHRNQGLKISRSGIIGTAIRNDHRRIFSPTPKAN